MDYERKRCSLDVKTLEQSGTFEGLLSVYDVIDEYHDVVERGAFTKSLQENGGSIPLLWQHDQSLPIGVLELRDGKDGLEAKGALMLDADVPQAKTAYALMKAGVVKGLSIGFKTIKKKMEDNIRRLKEIKLYEGSLVTIPANRFALIESVKGLNLNAEMKDFASELENIENWARRYQMLQALHYALDAVLYDNSGREEKLAATEEVLRQFTEAYMSFAPTLLDMYGVKGVIPTVETKANILSADSRKQLRECGQKLIALSEHSSTSGEAAEAAPDAKATEPDKIHSLLAASLERWDAILTR